MPIDRPTDSLNQSTPASGQTTVSNAHTVQELVVQFGVKFVDVAELCRTSEQLKATADAACLNLGAEQIKSQRLEQEARRTAEVCASLERQLFAAQDQAQRMRAALNAIHQVIAEQNGPEKVADAELAQVVQGIAVVRNDVCRTLNEYADALQPVRAWVDNADRLATLRRLVARVQQYELAMCEASGLRADLAKVKGQRDALRAQLEKIFAAVGIQYRSPS